jgi:hypothetical protein
VRYLLATRQEPQDQQSSAAGHERSTPEAEDSKPVKEEPKLKGSVARQG